MSQHHTTHENNPLPVRMNGNTTRHGEILQERAIPTIAGSPIYGFIPSNFRTFTGLGGSVGVENRLFKCSSGTTIGSYGTLQSFRSINYRTGGSAIIRCAGHFTSPQALTWSGIGGVAIGDEVSFGYDGLEFGVWHRYGGQSEVRTLQITAPASGAETVTLTINGTAHNIAVTAGTVQHNAYEIAEYIEANIDGFNGDQNDDSVTISSSSDGPKSNTWSVSSDGTLSGTVTQNEAGITKVSVHRTMAEWNGRDISKLVSEIDPAKGNNYEIHYSNGYGDIEYFIEDSHKGRYSLVHTERHTNLSTTPNFANPSLRCGSYATSIGSTTQIDVYTAYLAGMSTSSDERIRNPRATSNTKNIGTVETSLFQLRNKRIYNGFYNQAEIEPEIITLSNDGNKQAVFRLIGNPTLNGDYNFQDIGNNLIGEKDIAATTYVSGGRVLAEFTVARLSSVEIDLTKLDIRVPPTLRLCVTGRMISGSSADLTAAMTYYEDVA